MVLSAPFVMIRSSIVGDAGKSGPFYLLFVQLDKVTLLKRQKL